MTVTEMGRGGTGFQQLPVAVQQLPILPMPPPLISAPTPTARQPDRICVHTKKANKK